MTVADLPPSIDYLESGVALPLAVPFRFTTLAATRVLADGAEIELIAGGGFTIAGGATDAGGTLTPASSVAGAILRIRRVTARAQATDYTTGDRFPAESHEAALDRAMLIDQEQDDAHAALDQRALKVPRGEAGATLPRLAARAGKVQLIGHGDDGVFTLLPPGVVAKGDPGGSLLATGPFLTLSTLAIGAGVDLIQTSRFAAAAVAGVPSSQARYAAAADVTALTAAANPLWQGLDASGRGFKLAELRPHVHQLGAAGDGVTLDDAALLAAGAIAETQYGGFNQAGDGKGAYELGAGVYRVHTSGLLSTSGLPSRRWGKRVSGQNQRATVLWMDGADLTEKWFYDNGASACEWGFMLANLTLNGGGNWRFGTGYSDVRPNVKGLRITGGNGWDSANKLHNVGFAKLAEVLRIDGSDNADTQRLHMVDLSGNIDVNVINNPQAFCVSYSQSYQISGYGTFLRYGAGLIGGGNFSFNQGAIIQLADSGLETWVLDCDVGGPDLGNAPIGFTDTRIELRNSTTKAFRLNYGQASLAVRNTSILSVAGADKELLQISSTNRAKFDAVSLKEQPFTVGAPTTGRFLVRVGGVARRGRNARVVFADCDLPEDWWDRVLFEGANGGTVTVRGASGRLPDRAQAPAAIADIIVYDAEVSNTNSCNVAGRASTVRAVNLLNSNLPISGAAGLTGITTQFPPLQAIRKFGLEIVPGFGPAYHYRLMVGTADKSIVYATLDLATMNTGGYLVVQDRAHHTGPIAAVVMGYISGPTLTVTSVVSGRIEKGSLLSGSGAAGAVTAFSFVTFDQTGTYTLDTSQTIGSAGSPVPITLTAATNNRILCVWADNGSGGALDPLVGQGRIRAWAEYMSEYA